MDATWIYSIEVWISELFHSYHWTSIVLALVLTLCSLRVWHVLFWKTSNHFTTKRSTGMRLCPPKWLQMCIDYGLTVKTVSGVGYDIPSRCRSESQKRDYINTVRRRQKVGNLPPPFPNGWYGAVESADLGRSEVKELYILGMNLVAWRGNNGIAHIADAYCPHLGAHLGGGSVVGDCIKCPFHGWSFDGHDGHLKSIPYSDSIPSFVKLKMWLTQEMHGFVYIWFHDLGDQPSWFPDVISEVESGKWRYRGRSELQIECHLQDIGENVADFNHFETVHQVASRFTISRYVKDVFINPSWTACEELGSRHRATVRLLHNWRLFGQINLPSGVQIIHQLGPGLFVQPIDTMMGRGVLCIQTTPIEPLLQRLVARLYTAPTLLQPYASIYLTVYTANVNLDISIWNRKTTLKKPILTKHDRTIQKYLKWYSQFYSMNGSQKFFTTQSRKNTLGEQDLSH